MHEHVGPPAESGTTLQQRPVVWCITYQERNVILCVSFLLFIGGLLRLRPDAAPEPSLTIETPLAMGPLNINQADQDQLTQIPGIGRVLAQRIVEYRNNHGYFADDQDLLNVRGIGMKKLDAIRKHIVYSPGEGAE